MVQGAITEDTRSSRDGPAAPGGATADRGRTRRTRSIRLTLSGLLVVPLVSLVALWAFATSITLGSALREHDYNRLVALSSAPTNDLVNQVAQERLLTFTWLSTDPRPSEFPLFASRHLTDVAISAYRRMLVQTEGLRPASGSPP